MKALIYVYCKALKRVVDDVCDEAQSVTEVCGIRVFGPSSFAEGIEECMVLLEMKDPHGYSLVKRYLKRIVGIREAGILPRSVFLMGTAAELLDDSGRLRAAWACVAAHLVHCAFLTRCYVGFRRTNVFCKNSAYHLISMRRELLAAKRLEAPGYCLVLLQRELDEFGKRNRDTRSRRSA